MCFCLTTLQARVLCSPLAYLIFNKSRILLFLTQTLPEYKMQVTLHHHFNIRLIWVGYPVEGGGVTNVFQFLWRHDIRKTSLFNICVADSSATWLLLTHFRPIFHFYTPENFWKLEVLWRFQGVSNGTLAWNGLMKHKWFDPIKIALATF